MTGIPIHCAKRIKYLFYKVISKIECDTDLKKRMTLFKDSNTRMSNIMSSKIIINAHWTIGLYALGYQPQNIPQHTCKAANNTNFILVY